MRPIVKTIISGVGFLSDSYDLFIINIVSRVLTVVYPLEMTKDANASISTAALLGAVLGQLVCGALADSIGRRVIFISTLALIVVGSLGSATVYTGGSVSLPMQLAIWRGILGFGVGGEYPLSATVTSEGSANEHRGKSISAVFAMQGVGNLLASLVMLALLHSDMELDTVWRLALALGAAPGIITVYWRWKIEESEHFTRAMQGSSVQPSLVQIPSAGASRRGSATSTSSKDSQPIEIAERKALVGFSRHPDNQKQTLLRDAPASTGAARFRDAGDIELAEVHDNAAPTDEHTVSTAYPDRQHSKWHAGFVKTWENIREFRWVLLGTAGSWFIFDVIFYANGLFSSVVLSAIGIGAASSGGTLTREDVAQQAQGNSILAVMALPGYILAVLFIDRIGRRNMQLGGFAAMTMFFVILAAASSKLVVGHAGVFVFLYGMTFFFSNFGPNMTTFVIPAEAFPTRARATGHGISAAAGKLGAALGAAIMPLMLAAGGTKDQAGLSAVMWLCAALSVVGGVWTWLLTKETGGIDLSRLDVVTATTITTGSSTVTTNTVAG